MTAAVLWIQIKRFRVVMVLIHQELDSKDFIGQKKLTKHCHVRLKSNQMSVFVLEY